MFKRNKSKKERSYKGHNAKYAIAYSEESKKVLSPNTTNSTEIHDYNQLSYVFNKDGSISDEKINSLIQLLSTGGQLPTT